MAHRRADLRSTGRRFSAGEKHEANALTFAFHWKSFLGRREARSQCAHFCVPLEVVSRRRDTPDSACADSRSTGRPSCARSVEKTHPRKYVFQRNALFCKSASRSRCAQTSPPLEGLRWKSFLGERTVRSSPSHWNQNLSNEAITSFPRLSAGVDSNRVAPRVSRRRLPQPRFLRRGLSRRETRGARCSG